MAGKSSINGGVSGGILEKNAGYFPGNIGPVEDELTKIARSHDLAMLVGYHWLLKTSGHL